MQVGDVNVPRLNLVRPQRGEYAGLDIAGARTRSALSLGSFDSPFSAVASVVCR